jgi:bifunctional aspartokinase / homoserine dehydrogenase 1
MSAPAAWIVRKFGGSSVADANCVERVARLVIDDPAPRQAIVVSAARGVTDELFDLVDRAQRQDGAVRERLQALEQRHRTMSAALLSGAEARAVFEQSLAVDLRNLADILHATALVRAASDSVLELVAGFGELWSSRLIASALRERATCEVGLLDAREIVTIRGGDLGPVVIWPLARAALATRLDPAFTGILVIPGYVASDEQGVQTTLGRNGSDYSASIFGALLNAERIEIWTDVDGVLSADPRLVTDARIVRALSYHEAVELAYFGARVIHPQTMAPAIEHGIPIYIRNTFAPQEPGTIICAEPQDEGFVKGITSIDHIALVNLEGTGMIGVPGTAHRLFGALREAGVSVVLISQASSEHSICFAVPEADLDKAEHAVRRAFDAELREGQIQSLAATRGNSILAVVGEGMAGVPGVAARMFGALGGAGVNVRAIAQGSSERNISAVIDGRETTRALRAVHAGFYLSPHTISIGLIGPGRVGSTFLAQLASQAERLRSERRLDLRVRGIATSSRMLLAPRSTALEDWREALARDGVALDLERFADHVQSDQLPHAVIIDCTANRDIAEHYAQWLARGIHVITPNKKAGSGSGDYYDTLMQQRRTNRVHYLYETTVGAGLPILQTLRDLRETGDVIHSVEGILSGTLAYLFNSFDGHRPFSEIVRVARARGYTEPDPRDDLTGGDVANKLVILARELGLRRELDDVQVESLVPASLLDLDVDAFLDRYADYDAAMADRHRTAAVAGEVLRYVACLDVAGNASVRLERVSAEHPFARINLADNVVRFVTERYHENPLIVQGPGAGPDVTAAGVFADLLRLGTYLGASL